MSATDIICSLSLAHSASPFLSFPPSNWATTALVKAPSVNESLGQQWIEATATITITTTTAIIVFYIYHLRQLQSLLQLQLFFALILSAVVG